LAADFGPIRFYPSQTAPKNHSSPSGFVANTIQKVAEVEVQEEVEKEEEVDGLASLRPALRITTASMKR
jgi:hypothetical protein